ncbi:uncharacterized protein LOC130504467 isoform X2 [Raphanus sativus]|uniref:Uncharacterized protein LOC130504467 isoform X2 n=1 Tax=Raphanus sativus TaxID=3726 RepID=A0A9W3CU34_RAPSA|nr:uncharacterized protein LOC130504467 isoform X2 [Raphanus sativus]
MRVLLWSLRLENTPGVSSSTTTTVVDDDHYVDAHVEDVDGLLNEVRKEDCAIEKVEDCTLEEKQEEDEGQTHGEIILKSSFKKEALDSAVGERMEEERKKVQWVDLMGKELAEIREFECSEEDDIRYDGDKSCVCIIL